MMLADTADIVFVVIVDSAVIVAVVIAPVAVVILVFMLRNPLVLLLPWLVVACSFASVTGIFVACPFFG